jgi:hypothetical protein
MQSVSRIWDALPHNKCALCQFIIQAVRVSVLTVSTAQLAFLFKPRCERVHVGVCSMHEGVKVQMQTSDNELAGL